MSGAQIDCNHLLAYKALASSLHIWTLSANASRPEYKLVWCHTGAVARIAWLGKSTPALCAAKCVDCCATADGQNERASLAVCAARRWLARNAAGRKRIRSHTYIDIQAYVSLVSCLPALQVVELRPLSPPWEAGSFAPPPGVPGDLGCLLEALACCPRLEALVLGQSGGEQDEAR